MCVCVVHMSHHTYCLVGSEGSFESSSSDSNGRRAPPRPQRQGHNYHVVDRNSNVSVSDVDR